MATTNGQRWLYAIANLGNVIPYQAVGAVILFYYTDVKHLPAGWAAVLETRPEWRAEPLLAHWAERGWPTAGRP